jgi:hypothetical protein
VRAGCKRHVLKTYLHHLSTRSFKAPPSISLYKPYGKQSANVDLSFSFVSSLSHPPLPTFLYSYAREMREQMARETFAVAAATILQEALDAAVKQSDVSELADVLELAHRLLGPDAARRKLVRQVKNGKRGSQNKRKLRMCSLDV